MNKISSVIYFTLLLLLSIITPSNIFAGAGDGMRPTSPPKIPVVDYEAGAKIIDLEYMYYDSGDYTFNGFGAGYNYVGAFGNKYGYNIGFGGFYIKGSNGEGGTVLLSGNVAQKILNESTIMFGGINYSFTFISMDIYEGVDVRVHQWGPEVGFKSKIKVNENINFIPFYILRYDFYYMDVDVWTSSSYYYQYNEGGTLSNLFGFDIEFKSFSIGALFDLLNTGDETLIKINISFKL